LFRALSGFPNRRQGAFTATDQTMLERYNGLRLHSSRERDGSDNCCRPEPCSKPQAPRCLEQAVAWCTRYRLMKRSLAVASR
jgi:hypothetical protein